MADNLESYFKKHLSDDNPAEENWNVPSDDVWNKVLPEIQKKRGIFIPWRYLYIIGLLLVIGLALIIWPSDKIDRELENNIETTLEKNTQDQNTFAPKNEFVETNQSSKHPAGQNLFTEHQNKNSISTPIEIENENKLIQSENEISRAEYADTDKHENTLIPVGANSDKSVASSADVNDKSKQDLGMETIDTESPGTSFGKNTAQTEILIIDQNKFNTSAISSQEGTGESFSITPIEKISLNQISQLVPVMMAANKELPPLQAENNKWRKDEPFNNKGKFAVGAFFIPTFTSTYLKGDLEEGLMGTSGMYLYSNNWGIELKYFMSNRFALVSGVGRSQIRSWSKALVDFGYDPSTEHEMGGGIMENTSGVPMPTPFGEIDTEITYQFADAEFPDGEPMQSEMETHLDVTYVSIPLGVEYNILRFTHFSWFADAGLTYNRALKDSGSFSSRILHEGEDMKVVEEKMMSHPTYTENYLGFYLGTGLNYQFSKSFQVNASARYFGNITKVNLQDNMSTYVHGFNLKIGIVYIF